MEIAAPRARIVKTIYGLIVAVPVLAVMRDHPPSGWFAAAAVLGTTFGVALAEVYSEVIGGMLQQQHRLDRSEVREIFRDGVAVMLAALGPVIVLCTSGAGYLSVKHAIDISQVIVFVTLFGFGVRVGTLLHVTRGRQIVSGLILVGIAAAIVGIKVIVHVIPEIANRVG